MDGGKPTILVMGDKIIDRCMLQQEGVDKLFTWKATESFSMESGAPILHKILKSSLPDINVEEAFTRSGMETYMRWFKKDAGLFYEDTLFYTDAKPAENDKPEEPKTALPSSDDIKLLAIFNMNTRETYGGSFDFNKIKSSVPIVLRSRFIKQETPKEAYCMTPFVENVLKTGKLLKQTVLVLNVNDFRKGYSDFENKSLSWERLILQFKQAMDKIYKDGYEFKNVVMTVNHEGVLLYSRPNGKPRYDLVYFGNEMEGDYARTHTRVVGQITLMQAIIVKTLVEKQYLAKEDDIVEGAGIGLLAMRKLMEKGYSLNESSHEMEFPMDENDIKNLFENNNLPEAVKLEHKDIDKKLSIVDKKLEELNPEEFSLMCRNIANDKKLKTYLRMYPSLRLGNLISFNYSEIEKLRELYNDINNYVSGKILQSKPFSICVLGSPGSGKTFAVKEIISQLNKGQNQLQSITVDMSQFKSESDSHRLITAYQSMCDITVKGFVPVVFFDEFDSSLNGNPLGWLSSFIQPMYTGKFFDGTAERSIGRSIFIFAGSCAKDERSFRKRNKKDVPKKVDFETRISRWFSVPSLDEQSSAGVPSPKLLSLRRVLLIRSFLLTKRTLGINAIIEQGALNKLLDAKEIKDGARGLLDILDKSYITEDGHLTVGGLAPIPK